MIASSLESPAIGLWNAVRILLTLRWKIIFFAFRRGTWIRKLGYLFVALLILAAVIFIFYLSWKMVSFLNQPELSQLVGNPRELLSRLPAVLFLGVFIGILITSFGVLLQSFYLAGDLPFLLAKPLPIRAIFITKMLEAVLPNFLLLCAFSLPIIYGLGAAQDVSVFFYPAALLVVSALAAAAAGISSILVMVIVRIFPARRVAEILGFLGAMITIICSQSARITRWDAMNTADLSQVFRLFNNLDVPFSPFSWAGRGLLYLGSGDWMMGISLLSLTFLLGLGIFFISLATAERWYYTGWADMQSKLPKIKPPRHARKSPSLPTTAFLRGAIPPTIRAILVKDWIILRRDLRHMSQLIMPLIVGIAYWVMFFRQGGFSLAGRGEAPEAFMNFTGQLLPYANIIFALFVGWMLLARLAGMAFSQEGKNYWLIKIAPLKSSELITAKFLMAYLPALGLGWIFLMGILIMQKIHQDIALFSLLAVAMGIAGNAGINLAIGILGARLDWEDPRQMQRGSFGCLGTLATMIYLAACLALFITPPMVATLLGFPTASGQIMGLILGSGFCLLCVILPLLAVQKKVNLLGE